MLKVLQVCVRGRLRRGLCFEARRAPAAAGLGAARPPQDAGVAPVRSLTKGGVRVCTVDPHLEEQFLFLECTGRSAGSVETLEDRPGSSTSASK